MSRLVTAISSPQRARTSDRLTECAILMASTCRAIRTMRFHWSAPYSNWSDQTQSYDREWYWIEAFRHELVSNWILATCQPHRIITWRVMTQVFLLSYDKSIPTEFRHEYSCWVMTRVFLLSYDMSIHAELWHEYSHWVVTQVFMLSYDTSIPS